MARSADLVLVGIFPAGILIGNALRKLCFEMRAPYCVLFNSTNMHLVKFYLWA